MVEKITDVAKEISNELSDKIVTFMVASLGFVAALFWQDAIKDTISTFIPASGIWQYKLFAALLVTFFAVTTIYILTRLTKRRVDKQ